MENLASLFKERLIVIIFFSALILFILLVNKVQQHKQKHISEQDILFFRNKFESFQSKIDKLNTIEIVGGNRDALKNPSLGKIYKISMATQLIMAFFMVSILIIGLARSGFNSKLLFMAVIIFAICILMVVVSKTNRIDTIEKITLDRNNISIFLLDKNNQTDHDARPITYSLEHMTIKCKIEWVAAGDGQTPMKDYYVFIKTKNSYKKYAILLPGTDDADLKAFVAFANILGRSKYSDKLSEDEIRILLKDSCM